MSTTDTEPEVAEEQFENNDQGVHTSQITEYETQRFASLSGDHNDLHLNEAAAEESIFGGCIAHGMHAATFISTALEDLDGTIILMGIDLDFEAPVRHGDEVTAHAIPTETLNEDPEILRCRTTVQTQDGTDVITGEATVRRD